eukprot:1157220-Pelagomonas_calceolata.AAC.2
MPNSHLRIQAAHAILHSRTVQWNPAFLGQMKWWKARQELVSIDCLPILCRGVGAVKNASHLSSAGEDRVCTEEVCTKGKACAGNQLACIKERPNSSADNTASNAN